MWLWDKQLLSTCKTGMESAEDGPHMSDNNQAPILQNSVIKLDVDVYLREVSEILLWIAWVARGMDYLWGVLASWMLKKEVYLWMRLMIIDYNFMNITRDRKSLEVLLYR